MRFGKGDALAAAPFEMPAVAKQGLDRGRRGAKPWERRSPEWPGTNAQGACPTYVENPMSQNFNYLQKST